MVKSILSVSDFLKKVFRVLKKDKQSITNELQLATKLTPPSSTTAMPANDSKKAKVNDVKSEVISQPKRHYTQKKQNAVMLLIYQNEQQDDIARPQLISGLLGEQIQFRLRKLTNYTLINIKGFTNHFFTQYAIMIFIYRKQDGAPIRISFKDYDLGTLLQPTQLLKGKIGETYQIFSPEIKNFNLQTVSGKIKGFFSTQVQQITLYYRHHDWESVEKSDIAFVLLKDTACFAEIDAASPVLMLRAGTVWQTFSRITKYSQESWYNLGAFWIKYQPEAMTIQKKYRNLATDAAPILLGETTPIRQKASVNFTDNRSVHYFDYPNGQWIGKIADKTAVTLTRQIKIDQVIWYELADYGWLPSYYIEFN